MKHTIRSGWLQLGTLLYWAVRPVLVLYLRRSRRTRIVLRVGDEILVTRTWMSDGRWSLPGGGLHRSEDPVNGAVRELREETGINILPSKLSYLKTETYRNDGLTFTAIYYACGSAEKPSIRMQRFEICDYAWLRPAEVKPLTCTPDVLSGFKHLS